ncbi:MAG: hypothetical protein EOP48_26200, partial [Sphingobacteriales bacterium]
GDRFTSTGVNFIKAEAITLEGQIDESKFAYIDIETNEKLKRSQLKEGDVLFSMAGVLLGKTAVVDKTHLPANTNQAVALIRLKTEIVNPYYLHYYFRQKNMFEYVNSITAQSAQPNINLFEIGEIEIPIPDITVQNKIASTLLSIDSKIQNYRQINRTLENIAATIFQETFVSEIDNETLPARWEYKSIYDLGTFINGAAFKEKDFTKCAGALPVIKIVELKSGITASTRRTGKTLDRKYRIKNGDILFSWSGSPETSIDTYLWTRGDGWLNQHIFKVEAASQAEKLFLFYLLKYFKPVFIGLAKNKQTTGLGHVTIDDLKRLKTAFPPEEVLSNFFDTVAPIWNLYKNNLMSIEELLSLRESLLQKLYSLNSEATIYFQNELLHEALFG